MASLELRADRYRVVFRFGGKKYSTTLNTTNHREAQALRGGVEKTLLRLEQGLLDLPIGADICSFVLTEGRRTEKPKAVKPVTLAKLVERYCTELPAGAMEANSLQTVLLHMQHFQRILGGSFPVQTLQFPHLQGYVQTRAAQRYRGRAISPTTIRKEVTSFSGVWRWGRAMGLLTGSFPNQGLRYPKTTEKPPFQTWTEIERQIARGGLSKAEIAELWECMYLTLPEIEELLQFVWENARYGFLYPMTLFAAHSGARRSEMMRSRVNDVDFVSNTVLIHEKKRVKGKRTTRRVPMSPRLAEVMRDWLDSHPGGSSTFCHDALHIPQSNKTRMELMPLTKNEANHHLQRLLAGSKWDKIRGWHVFRHSFASNCASLGVDQRLIDEWLGHQTEEMRKRYRHLLPDQQQKSIQAVFGSSSATAPATAPRPESVPIPRGKSSIPAKAPGRNSASWHAPA